MIGTWKFVLNNTIGKMLDKSEFMNCQSKRFRVLTGTFVRKFIPMFSFLYLVFKDGYICKYIFGFLLSFCISE